MVTDKTPHRGDWSTTQQGNKTDSWEHRWISKAWGCHIKEFSQNAVLGPPSLQFNQTWNASRISGLYSLPVAKTAMENLSLGSVCCATLSVGLKKNPGDEVSGETRKATSTCGGGCWLARAEWASPLTNSRRAVLKTQLCCNRASTGNTQRTAYLAWLVSLSLPCLQTQANGSRNSDNISKSH